MAVAFRDGCEHVEAVQPGKQEIEHDEVPRMRLDLLERLVTVAGDRGVIAGSVESTRDEPCQQRLVFSDQDMHGRGGLSDRTTSTRPGTIGRHDRPMTSRPG